MIIWKSFGATVRGPGHIATGKPNQDAWASFHRTWGDGVVVSDGLGSKPFSNWGSHAACFAVKCAVRACSSQTTIDLDHLFDSIKTQWLYHIAPLDPHDCAATCLFAFRLRDGAIQIGMLGDGLASALKSDGSVVSLEEDKSQGFSNITTALSAKVTAKDWRHLSVAEDDFTAVVLCTDGVADDLDDSDGFVKGFAEEYCALAALSASRRARGILENWPTPKHSDDKTIACLCREDVPDA